MTERYSSRPPPRFALGARLAIAAAIGSIIASCSGHGLWGLILAMLSLPLGLIGFIVAISPEVRGGLASILAIGLGIVGLIVSILEIVFKIVLFPLHW